MLEIFTTHRERWKDRKCYT